jgi:hypothetical protein
MLSLLIIAQALTANPGAAPVGTRLGGNNPMANRLTRQYVRGAQRICVYGMGPRATASSVGRGEPCPFHYLAEDPQPVMIPSMAMLREQTRAHGGTVCTYSFGGRQFVSTPRASTYCPLTPSGAAEPLIADLER